MYRSTLRAAVVSGFVFAAFGLTATPALAAGLITPVDIATNFNGPIGVDYYQPTNEMLLSANYSSGQPFTFNVVHADGTHTQFSAVSGLTDEVYLAAIRSSACMGGFTTGDVFVGTGTGGEIGKITNGGATFIQHWVQLPGESGLLRGGLFQDRYCSFGGDLIITTTERNVWRVTSAGVATRVATNVGDTLEGPTTVPNDTRYGPWAGKILVSSEVCGCVESVDALGNVATYSGYSSAEGVHVVPAAENFFGVNFAAGKLVGIAAADLVSYVGDVLVATEAPGRLIDVRWDPVDLKFIQQDVINPISQFEGTAFGPVGIANLPPPEQPVTASGTIFTATEGGSFSGTVATFIDLDTTATAADYSSSINWGDGTSDSSGAISGLGGSFSVNGTHTYAEEGTYTVTVTITDNDATSNTATATSTGQIGDAALTAAATCQSLSERSYGGPVASFTDAARPSGTLSDFSAIIDWGDGSTSAGTVSGLDGGPYGVSGAHTYAATGIFNITTTVTDTGGSHATVQCSTLAFAFAPGGGSFVIGDQNAAHGNTVEFWGAQWAKDNTLSGGPAPRSFKGFAESPSAPACGVAWTTDTGSSTPPPAGPLPTYMAVIVAGTVTQAGSTVSGDAPHIVVVKTDAGYAPDSGHAGTGTVVAVVC